MAKDLLTATDVSMVFGGLKAVVDFNVHIKYGELLGLIGPNGAGKTTAFNLFTGVYQPTTGEILFKDKSIVGLAPYQITERGIARTFQNIRLFGELTVLDNVKIAYHCHMNYGLIEAVLRVGRYWEEERKLEEEAYRLLEIFHLADAAQEKAKNLPYGAQRRLEIARALAAQPSLLLLDEPAAGMNPQETLELMEMIRWVKKNSASRFSSLSTICPSSWASASASMCLNTVRSLRTAARKTFGRIPRSSARIWVRRNNYGR